MKQSRPDQSSELDSIDALLRLGYLEGVIRTHGAYEKAVVRRNLDAANAYRLKGKLLVKLEYALEKWSERGPETRTMGDLLKSVRSENKLHPEDIYSRLGIAPKVYRELEEDQVLPTKLSVSTWEKIGRFFNLSTEDLVEIVRRTHRLVCFRPQFAMTLARYDSRKNKNSKADTLDRAARELFLKAALSIPRAEELKLDELLRSLEQ